MMMTTCWILWKFWTGGLERVAVVAATIQPMAATATTASEAMRA